MLLVVSFSLSVLDCRELSAPPTSCTWHCDDAYGYGMLRDSAGASQCSVFLDAARKGNNFKELESYKINQNNLMTFSFRRARNVSCDFGVRGGASD